MVQADALSSKYCSMVVHFDSAGSLGGVDPRKFRDPTFFTFADRFFELAARYHCPLTIFITGQDLLNDEVAGRVRDWSQAGHEIASHSFSHHVHLGALPATAIREEISKAHEIIEQKIKISPRGFVAPNWSTSRDVVQELLARGYEYDISLFPSAAMLLVNSVLWLREQDPAKRRALWDRRDLPHSLWWPRWPFVLREPEGPGGRRELVMLPMPTVGWWRLPVWHTAALMYPPGLFARALKSACAREYMYYVMHPADIFDNADLRAYGLSDKPFARMRLDSRRKIAMLANSWEILSRTYSFVTLRNMAHAIKGGAPGQKARALSLNELFPAK